MKITESGDLGIFHLADPDRARSSRFAGDEEGGRRGTGGVGDEVDRPDPVRRRRRLAGAGKETRWRGEGRLARGEWRRRRAAGAHCGPSGPRGCGWRRATWRPVVGGGGDVRRGPDVVRRAERRGARLG